MLLIIALLSSSSLSIEKQTFKDDPSLRLNKTLHLAKKEKKLVLIIFGSDWCKDCISFKAKISNDKTKEIIDNNFIVMNVDTGMWNKNMDFTNSFNNPIDSGIPSIAIINFNKSILYVSNKGEFASASTLDDIIIYKKIKNILFNLDL
ncbi:thioredoxin family protein [Pseudoalteromonas sp. '520P1 No. 423']|nr:thioredoxin family protein [Pseudoalteromonas sp. '520P1 No. 423']